MRHHLRYAGTDPATQEQALREIIAQSPSLTDRLTRARDWNLPDCWIVSGAIYNTVWNYLTDRPDMFGVKDIDLFYFYEDRSYEAEDRLIRDAETPRRASPELPQSSCATRPASISGIPTISASLTRN